MNQYPVSERLRLTGSGIHTVFEFRWFRAGNSYHEFSASARGAGNLYLRTIRFHQLPTGIQPQPDGMHIPVNIFFPLVEKNGSKIRCMSFSQIPHPVSRNDRYI